MRERQRLRKIYLLTNFIFIDKFHINPWPVGKHIFDHCSKKTPLFFSLVKHPIFHWSKIIQIPHLTTGQIPYLTNGQNSLISLWPLVKHQSKIFDHLSSTLLTTDQTSTTTTGQTLLRYWGSRSATLPPSTLLESPHLSLALSLSLSLALSLTFSVSFSLSLPLSLSLSCSLYVSLFLPL